MVVFISYTHSRERGCLQLLSRSLVPVLSGVTLGHVAQDSDSINTDEGVSMVFRVAKRMGVGGEETTKLLDSS